MANVQQIKRRRASVESIGKITNAMQLVSTSKSKKAVDLLYHSREYYMEIERMLGNILKQEDKDIFSIGPKDGKDATLWIIVSSNLGLCGSFNSQVFKKFESAKKGKDDQYISIGTKAEAYLKRNNLEIFEDFSMLSDILFNAISKKISQIISRKVKEGEISHVKVVYTKYINQITSEPKIFDLYPLTYNNKDNDNEETANEKKSLTSIESEISKKEDLRSFVRFYSSVVLYGLLTESMASEQVSRRVSMENATSNSKELVDKLNIEFNRTRQAMITQQIAEIIGGSE
ncbi:MAG: ATP synthase F1 subunit gamma [Mycoplasmataceae bacterium]|nr:ATP synthase F1 subunit gamma [Mycoplasmataceae bacterium]